MVEVLAPVVVAELTLLETEEERVWVHPSESGSGAAWCCVQSWSIAAPLVAMTFLYQYAESLGVRFKVSKSTWMRPKRSL